MNKINASIITIGDELLIGQTIDTNSAFIAQELNKIGVWVKRRVAVGDVYDDIWKALDEERKVSVFLAPHGKQKTGEQHDVGYQTKPADMHAGILQFQIACQERTVETKANVNRLLPACEGVVVHIAESPRSIRAED